MKIIKTSEALPKSGRYVLAWLEGAKIPMRAMWADQHTLPLGDDADPEWGEYSEEKDEYFCPAGWYEMNQFEEQHWGVSGNVVAWCELPRLDHQCLAQIEEPAQHTRVVLDDRWKARMLDGRAIERDEMGLGDHPELPMLDEGMMPRSFFAALGLELAHTSAEDQLDWDVLGAMSEAVNWTDWQPNPPHGDGWKLVSIFDTEDGPVAWWLRELPEAEDGTTTIRILQAEVEKLKARLAHAGAAPAAVAPRGEYPHEQMDAMALDRYKVVPSNASMLWSHAVVAGDGTQQLYVGREVECQNMVRKFAGAFLDGAFAFHSTAAAPTAQAAPALEAPAAPAVPAGFALVPIEPTQQMLDAGRWSGAGSVSIQEEWARKEMWSRMLATITPPPAAYTDDLVALVENLAQALSAAAPDNNLAGHALNYLKRNGLQESPLRAAEAAPQAPAAPSEPIAWMATPVMQSGRGTTAVFCSDGRLAEQWNYGGHPEYGRMIVTGLYAAPVAAPAAPVLGRSVAEALKDLQEMWDDMAKSSSGPSHERTMRRFGDALSTIERTVAAPAAPAVDAQGERDAAFEAVRQRLCRIPRWSFHIDSRGNLRRVDDARGNWIEFSAAHELFDPVAVDSALAAQAKEGGAAA